MSELKEHQEQTQKIIQEELTKLWNVSEVPTLKIITEQLNTLITHINNEKGKEKQAEGETSNQRQTTQDMIKVTTTQPELVPIDAWRRTKTPIMVDISKMKPKIPEEVAKTLDGLTVLHKKGQF